MRRYAAFLRGVSPLNANMPDLRRAFESAGFADVRTVLSSGNVVFSAGSATEAVLPYRAFRLDPGAKRVVTFLRDKPRSQLRLPMEVDGARILALRGREVFTAYVRTPKGPVFMRLIEKTFGQEQTTRTWETVVKVARA
ncbi:MAG: DUF1697 domain-containing protein [Methanobacteriota archaeon]|nr:MAG: DUF1697 domain-containing protein [Euryarchaeota archaeon]